MAVKIHTWALTQSVWSKRASKMASEEGCFWTWSGKLSQQLQVK